MNLKQIKSREKVPFLSGYALKTGIHVGHKSLRLSKSNFWHPLMAQYFLGIRHGIALLNPVETRKCLLRAFYVIALILKTTHVIKKKQNLLSSFEKNKKTHSSINSGCFSKEKQPPKQNSSLLKTKSVQETHIVQNGHILVINTNPEFSRLCKNLSVLTLHESKKNKKNSGFSLFDQVKKTKEKQTIIEAPIFQKIDGKRISYIHYKWVGGTLTNWKQVSKSVLTYAKFSERCEKFLSRNTIEFPRLNKIKECFHGLIRKKQGKVYLAFNEKPDLVFLMNPNENRHIIAEANKMHIPVIALVESNSSLKGISYPIPANVYSARFLYYCLKKILFLSTF